MSREYRHMQEYEQEILELRNQGLTFKEIGKRYGFTHKQLHDFFTRYNRKQRKLEAGMEIKPKGRPRKDGTKLPPSIQQLSKVSQLRYELASKERHIKRLEMELELIQDFLSLAERK